MVWTARNTNLSGSALNVNFIAQHPGTKNLTSINHILCIATDDGLYFSSDGGAFWAKLPLPNPSNAEFGDSPAATINELTFHWFAFDPVLPDTWHALGAKVSTLRLWLYRSTNAGLSWSSRGVLTV